MSSKTNNSKNLQSKIEVYVDDFWFNDNGQIIAEIVVHSNGHSFETTVLLNKEKVS